MKRSAWLVVAFLFGSLSTGCVTTRRYVITSDPPGAIVYRDGQPIGATPVEEPFTYYGKYKFRLVKDGYQPLDVTPELVAPWYQWPGLDLVSELLIPYPFRDVQSLHFQLQPQETVRPDDLRLRAEQLRQRGSAIQTPPGTESAPKRRDPRMNGPAVLHPQPGLIQPAPGPMVTPPVPGGPVPGPVAPVPSPVLGAPRRLPNAPAVIPSQPGGSS